MFLLQRGSNLPFLVGPRVERGDINGITVKVGKICIKKDLD